jgi:hypothetical protein
MQIQYMTFLEFERRWKCGFFKNASNDDLIEIINELIAERNELDKQKNLEYEHVLLSV